MLLQVRKRIDSVECWIERRFDGRRLCRGGLPQVDFVGSFEITAVNPAQYLHAWTIGIGGIRLHHDSDFSASKTDEVAGWVDADKLSESPHQVLIELGSVVAFQHRKDPIRWKRRLVVPLRTHRVVHVRYAA